MTIPKFIHYVWIGSKSVPLEASSAILQWKKIMPDFIIKEWNEKNIDFDSDFIRGAYAVRAYNRTSNYARLKALYLHGGLYFDHDIEVVKDFTPLLSNECFFGFQTLRLDEAQHINNAVIGAVPGHPFIGRLLEEMDAMDGRADVGAETGPGLVSKLLRAEGAERPSKNVEKFNGVTVYPPQYFYPYDWTQSFDRNKIQSETYAVHHWAHTWKNESSLFRSLINKTNRVIAYRFLDLGYYLQRCCNMLWRAVR